MIVLSFMSKFVIIIAKSTIFRDIIPVGVRYSQCGFAYSWGILRLSSSMKAVRRHFRLLAKKCLIPALSRCLLAARYGKESGSNSQVRKREIPLQKMPLVSEVLAL